MNSPDMFRALLDQAHEAFLVIHLPSLRLTGLNQAAAILLGRRAGDSAGFDIAAAGGENPMAAAILALLGSGGQVPHTERTASLIAASPDGEKIYLETSIRFVPSAGDLHAVIVGLDISERIAAERQIRNHQMLLQTILDAIPAPIFYKDAQGRYLGCNNAFGNFLRRARTEIIGRSVFDFHPEGLAQLRAEAEPLKPGGIQPYEVRVADGEGKERDFLVHASVFDDGSGRPAGLVGAMLDISERKAIEEKMEHLALYDPMTGLPNRMLFADRLAQALVRARRIRKQVALLFMDLDHFKEINDALGHAGGDEMLRAFGQRLSAAVRQSDTVARLAGDEFAVILSELAGEKETAIVAGKILEQIDLPFVTADGQEIHLSASMGIAVFPQDGDDGETLLRHADLAMYEAKNVKVKQFRFYSPAMNRKTAERRELLLRLRRAVQEGQFFLEYQPQFDVPSERVIGAEVLLRWRLPDGSVLFPDRFIPVAEEAGLIRPIGEWVLAAACRQGSLWQRAGYPPLRIAVNISAQQLKEENFLDILDAILKQTGFAPEYLELEVTESLFMENVQATVEILHQIRRRGIQLALDDFGTGYSSLSYLRHFPINRIKIDRSFIRDLEHNSDDAVIVQTIIAMGKNLGLSVIAEGVEKRPQKRFLLLHECREMQGFLFGAPVSPTAFPDLFLGC